MRTLILYATKHGAAEEIANRIARKMEGATLCNLAKGTPPAPDGYDCVIIGSSVYANMLRKEAKAYVKKHADALCARKLGLYVAGLQPDGEDGYLGANYPKEVVSHAAARAMLGGICDPKNVGLFERLILRIASGQAGYLNTIADDKIEAFVRALQ